MFSLAHNVLVLYHLNKFNKKKLYPLIAVPTTAGSGSESTPNAVIYIDKKKYTVENQCTIPNKFCLFPEFTLSNTREIKSSSGFDAIAQSLESLMSVNSNFKSIKFASNSLKISLKNYLNFLNRPNLQYAKKMSEAANLSGKAIAISKTTAPHALSYPFTAYFNFSHGHAVSLTIEKLKA